MDGPGGLDVVIDEDIVGERFEYLVEVAGGIEQAGLVEPIDNIVLCLLQPLSLRSERTVIGCFVGDILGISHADGGVFGVGVGNFEGVAPDIVDGFKFEGVVGAFGIALLDIEGGGEPEVGLHVGAPTVEVVELLHAEDGAGEVTIKADDVSAIGLDPDAPKEPSEVISGAGGRDVEDCCGDVAEEVVAYEGKGVMLAVEVIGVHEEHLDEARLMEGETKAVGDTGEGGNGVFEVDEVAFFGAEVAFVVLVFVIVDDPAEVDSGQEVLVGLGHLVEDGSGFIFWMYVSTRGARSRTTLTISFSRRIALSIKAYCAGVGLMPEELS